MGDTPQGDDLGGGHTAGGSGDASESGANPQVLKDYSEAGLERLAGLRDRLSGLRGSLAQVRTSIAYLSADLAASGAAAEVPLSSELGHDGEGVPVEDNLDALLDNWEHLDGFAARVAAGFLDAEGIEAGSDAADRTYTVPSTQLATAGIGFADRNAAVAEGERLAEQATDLDGMTATERWEWVQAVERGQLDTAFSVAFANELGTDGLEAIGEATEPSGDQITDQHTAGLRLQLSQVTGQTLDTALATDTPDSETPYDQRIDATLVSDLWDNPDLIRPFATPNTTPALNHTLGLGDARRVQELLEDAGNGLGNDHADLYPELAGLLDESAAFHGDEAYAVAFTNRFSTDELDTLINLNNGFGLSHPQMDESAAEVYEGYVVPVATLLSAAEQSGDMRDDLHDVAFDIGHLSHNSTTHVERTRSRTLLLFEGHFTPETTALLAENISHPHLGSHENLRGVEGFTTPEFLSSEPERAVLANNRLAAYTVLADQPEAASIFYSDDNGTNLRDVLRWPLDLHRIPPIEITADRLGISEDEAEQLMQETAAGSVRAGLTSDNDSHRAAAMNTAIETISDLSSRDDITSNPYMYEALADGTAANLDVFDARVNEPWSGDPQQGAVDAYVATGTFLREIASDPNAARTIRNAVTEYGLAEVGALTSDRPIASRLEDLGRLQELVTTAEAKALEDGAISTIAEALDADGDGIGPTPGSLLDYGLGKVPFGGDIYDIIMDVNDAAGAGNTSFGAGLDWVLGKVQEEQGDPLQDLSDAQRAGALLRVDDDVNQGLWLVNGLYDSDIPIGHLVNADPNSAYAFEADGYTEDTPISEILHDMAEGRSFVGADGNLVTDPNEEQAQALREWADELRGSTDSRGPLYELDGDFDIGNNSVADGGGNPELNEEAW